MKAGRRLKRKDKTDKKTTLSDRPSRIIASICLALFALYLASHSTAIRLIVEGFARR